MNMNLCEETVYQILLDSQKMTKAEPRRGCSSIFQSTFLGLENRICSPQSFSITVSNLSFSLRWADEEIAVLIYSHDYLCMWCVDILMSDGIPLTWQRTFASETDALSALENVLEEIKSDIGCPDENFVLL